MTNTEKFIRARKQLGLTQEALAREMDVSLSAVSKWERGEVDVSTLHLLAIHGLAVRMGRTIDW